ncbi:hypothetical protein AVEN_134686-1 [Araneus ventricosus]|uniref:Uncharacterized protein n=1 Tax=Araneus ventricosus TaxID=182803 RepID=A0A4Y2LQV1_ARAVE|nr:hypothetical protein AVEN_134686-1 [Araneus ventricosus]
MSCLMQAMLGIVLLAWMAIVAVGAPPALECGKQTVRNGRIVGGDEAFDGEFPFLINTRCDADFLRWKDVVKRQALAKCSGSPKSLHQQWSVELRLNLKIRETIFEPKKFRTFAMSLMSI